MMEQKVVKELLPPPPCWIWKQQTLNSWATRYGNLPQISRSITKYGETAALQIVISNAWKDYCLLNGIPEEECGMTGLVDVDCPDLD